MNLPASTTLSHFYPHPSQTRRSHPSPPRSPYTTLSRSHSRWHVLLNRNDQATGQSHLAGGQRSCDVEFMGDHQDRKSTRLSSHLGISYAVFCLKKKKKKEQVSHHQQDHPHD